MGYTIFVDRVLRGEPITIFGDGEQTRGNTYVLDAVEATVLAARRGRHGQVYNVGGGESRSANWIVETIQRLAGRDVEIVHGPARPGEQRDALAVTTKAQRELTWEPRTSLEDGLRAQIDYQRPSLPAPSESRLEAKPDASAAPRSGRGNDPPAFAAGRASGSRRD